MPLMSRDEHEALLNELLNSEIDHTRRTEILQQLRVDHVTGHSDYEGITKTNEKLQKDNNDLITSNSMLFRQVGVVGSGKEKEFEQQEQAKTITIEDLERSAK